MTCKAKILLNSTSFPSAINGCFELYIIQRFIVKRERERGLKGYESIVQERERLRIIGSEYTTY